MTDQALSPAGATVLFICSIIVVFCLFGVQRVEKVYKERIKPFINKKRGLAHEL